ncbi:uncharacterized protein BP5553_08178 [Venustampulla echinocandica]|uniref:Uncharacterized protein n=1 Tax=Venustampulla echinocandica TaxID=2656787 RepID=A0A370TFY6_9HELO|nr:uncharacterized protein BP5553_08178 [Venustampulla echinocandica]RDL33810.1 hypothetical protein BP5553_08178 [Venustampulla echinocandica]
MVSATAAFALRVSAGAVEGIRGKAIQDAFLGTIASSPGNLLLLLFFTQIITFLVQQIKKANNPFSSDSYSQCIPGTDPNAPTPTSPGGSSPSGGPGTTLQKGYYWIRAVADPNFHKYLQTKPQYVPGTAILDSYTSAGQFQIVDGQLEQLITDGLLYANVQPAPDASANKLSVTFNTTKNAYGTFAFSGDAVQWSHPDVKRQNLSAWLVCAAQTLWINLGAYGYMTPAGCADQTIDRYQTHE